jgi:putative transposase
MNKLPLDVRLWECPECDTIHDRDIAAKNIKAAGHAVLALGENVSRVWCLH